MGAHVDRHRLIGKEQLFRDHQAYWDGHRDALFISSLQAHSTSISPELLADALKQRSERCVSSRTLLYPLRPSVRRAKWLAWDRTAPLQRKGTNGNAVLSQLTS